jgi:hypothetical protein
MTQRIPGVDTLGDLIDRLIVTVHKLAFFENKKREEHAKTHPDVAAIAKWDNASRDCCELRSIIKSRIDELMGEIVESGEYKVMREVRTFRPPASRLSDVLAHACREYADWFATKTAEELLP